MKISYVLTAFAVSAVVSTSAMAGAIIVGSAGGSYSNQAGGNLGVWSQGGADAHGSVNGVSLGGAYVNNTSTSGTVNVAGVGGTLVGGNVGGAVVGYAAGGTSQANNNVQVGSTAALVQSNTNASNSSGAGNGFGGNTSTYVGGNVAGIGGF